MKKPTKKKSLSLTRKKYTFKLPELIDDPILESEVRDSFKRAFFVKNLTYKNE